MSEFGKLADVTPTEPGSRQSPHRIESAADHKRIGARANRDPSEGQKKAGNYKMEHLVVEGLRVTIETPRGAHRSGTSEDGKAWSARMPAHYGYLRATRGNDDDHVDCFIGKGKPTGRAYVIDQYEPKTGRFDEHKVVLLVESPEAAVRLYQRSFGGNASKGRMGAVSELSIEELKKWLAEGARTMPLYTDSEPLPDNMEHVGHGQAFVGRQTFAAEQKRIKAFVQSKAQITSNGSPEEKAMLAKFEKRLTEIGRRQASAKDEKQRAALYKREIALMEQASKLAKGAQNITEPITSAANDDEPSPPMEGARRAPDGEWYLPDPARPGKYLQVVQH
jgi:hypothetical protein